MRSRVWFKVDPGTLLAPDRGCSKRRGSVRELLLKDLTSRASFTPVYALGASGL